MHPIIEQQMVQYRIDGLARHAQAQRLAALASATTDRPAGIRDRFARTAGRLHLMRRPAAA